MEQTKIPRKEAIRRYASKTTLWRLEKEGKLKSYRLPGFRKIFYDVKELEALIQ